MPVKQVSDGTLSRELTQADEKMVLVDFFASWCGPCQTIAPIIDKLSSSHPNTVFLKVNIDQCPMEAAKYNTRSVPTLVFILYTPLDSP